jgi:hypothetical protein
MMMDTRIWQQQQDLRSYCEFLIHACKCSSQKEWTNDVLSQREVLQTPPHGSNKEFTFDHRYSITTRNPFAYFIDHFYLLLIAMIIRSLILKCSQDFVHLASQPKFRDRPNMCCGRLKSLFGVGWFLEWPEGQRPLNSTWPWSGIKLSIVVLWGVCWMFYMRLNNSQRSEARQRRPQVSTWTSLGELYDSSSNHASLGKRHSFIQKLSLQ